MLRPLTEPGSRFHAPQVRVFQGEVQTAGGPSAVVLMHGLGDAGSNPGMQSLAKSIMTKYPNSYAVAVDVANGLASFFQRMPDQTAEFAKAVSSDPKLKDGFDVIGLSQGGLTIRDYVQNYAGRNGYPAVRKFISICGVQNGVFDCPAEVKIIPFLCDAFKSNPYDFLHLGLPLSFSDYFVTSMNETQYLHENKYLPALNNQLPNRNASYVDAITKLDKMFLVEATKDTVVYPFASEQFGGYQFGTKDTVFTLRQGRLYTDNLFGLKTLDQASKVQTSSFVGDHLRFSNQYWEDTILPVLA